jgi:hypothetical protein
MNTIALTVAFLLVFAVGYGFGWRRGRYYHLPKEIWTVGKLDSRVADKTDNPVSTVSEITHCIREDIGWAATLMWHADQHNDKRKEDEAKKRVEEARPK